jgi:hypothetical protein
VLVTQQPRQASSFQIQSANPRKRTFSTATSLAEAGSNNSNDDDAHDAPQKIKSKRSLVIWDCDGVLHGQQQGLQPQSFQVTSVGLPRLTNLSLMRSKESSTAEHGFEKPCDRPLVTVAGSSHPPPLFDPSLKTADPNPTRPRKKTIFQGPGIHISTRKFPRQYCRSNFVSWSEEH